MSKKTNIRMMLTVLPTATSTTTTTTTTTTNKILLIQLSFKLIQSLLLLLNGLY